MPLSVNNMPLSGLGLDHWGQMDMDFKTLHLEGVSFGERFLYEETVQAEKHFSLALRILEYWAWEY